MTKAYHLRQLDVALLGKGYNSAKGHLFAITEDKEVELFVEASDV